MTSALGTTSSGLASHFEFSQSSPRAANRFGMVPIVWIRSGLSCLFGFKRTSYLPSYYYALIKQRLCLSKMADVDFSMTLAEYNEVNSMPYIKVKKWMQTKGYSAEELSTRPGKPSLLVLLRQRSGLVVPESISVRACMCSIIRELLFASRAYSCFRCIFGNRRAELSS